MMYEREIERKFVIQGESYEEAFNSLICKSRIIVDAISFDNYWKAPHVDFVRLRDNTGEITVKVTDKATIIDRIEENVLVYRDSMSDAKRLLTLLFGAPTLRLTKKFSVFEYDFSPGPGTSFKAIICLYQIEDDPEKRLFFEVEAKSLAVVDGALGEIGKRFKLKPENRSLFQIFKGNK